MRDITKGVALLGRVFFLLGDFFLLGWEDNDFASYLVDGLYGNEGIFLAFYSLRGGGFFLSGGEMMGGGIISVGLYSAF